MTAEILKSLIQQGETVAVEFKGEESGSLSDRDLVEAVVCLANRSGEGFGWLLVGVEDDGRVSGARPRHESSHIDPLRIQALVANRTRPSLSTRVEVAEVNGHEVLVVEVPAMRQPVGTADGRYLRRAIGGDGKPACVPFHFHEMQSQQGHHGLLDHSALPLDGVGIDALDPLEFDRYRRSIRENRTRGDEALLALSNVELARALGALESRGGEETVRVLGLLLFGQEEVLASALPTHEVAFQEISGTDVLVNDFFRGPLLRVMEELSARFQARNREREMLVGMTRVGVADYAERSFREAIANALVHRDYTSLGAVHIQWRTDRLEVSNPGGFPAGVRLDNLLVTAPRPRNPLLADALKRAGLVERTGRGIDTIFYEQLRNGRAAPSYERSTETGVTLALAGGEPNLGLVRLVAEEGRSPMPLSLEDLLVLTALAREGRMTALNASAVLQREEVAAQDVLKRLEGRGLVSGQGARERHWYQLSEDAARRIGDGAGDQRRRVEPAGHGDLVRRYVEEHGSISRTIAANLCDITYPQAYRLLNRLVSEAALRRVGTRGRNVRYEKSE